MKCKNFGIRKWDCGLRPIGAYAYAPAGRRKKGRREIGKVEFYAKGRVYRAVGFRLGGLGAARLVKID
jgi:hypothetical protein